MIMLRRIGDALPHPSELGWAPGAYLFRLTKFVLRRGAVDHVITFGAQPDRCDRNSRRKSGLGLVPHVA